jgi:hypothetical protein
MGGTWHAWGGWGTLRMTLGIAQVGEGRVRINQSDRAITKLLRRVSG